MLFKCELSGFVPRGFRFAGTLGFTYSKTGWLIDSSDRYIYVSAITIALSPFGLRRHGLLHEPMKQLAPDALKASG